MSDTPRPTYPSRVWLRADAFLPRNPKIHRLPSDSARWAYVVSLCEAKLCQVEGEWPTEDHWRIAVGSRCAKHLEALIAARLIERTEDGGLAVHDWQEWQPKDPTAAERARRYRDKKKAERDARDGTRDATDRHVDISLQTPQTSHFTPAAGISRKTGNGEVEGTADWEPAWRPFLEGWRALGFRLPPSPAQREKLWPIIDARPTDAGRWVAGAPPGASAHDVVGHVFARYKALAATVAA